MAKVVQLNRAHTLIRGERMEYKFGNTTIIREVKPGLTPEESEQAERDLHMAAWDIIDELLEKGEAV